MVLGAVPNNAPAFDVRFEECSQFTTCTLYISMFYAGF